MAANLVFHRGKGHNNLFVIPPAQRDFLKLARGIGLPCANIARLLGWTAKSTAHRTPAIAKQDGGIPFADWREHRDRFPWVARAVYRFLVSAPLDADELSVVAGIMRAWSRRYGLGINISNARLSIKVLMNRRRMFIAAGFDPFAEVYR